MAGRPPVKCRVCGLRFQRDDGVEGVDWVNPRKNQFYHKNCYDTWITELENKATDPKITVEEDLYLSYIYDLFTRDLKISVDYQKLKSQFNNFAKKKGINKKGLFYAVYYYYIIKKNDPSKAEGGIGIAPYVYDESREYWISQEKKKAGAVAGILKQMEDRRNREKILVKKTNSKKKKYVSHLDEIGDMDD